MHTLFPSQNINSNSFEFQVYWGGNKCQLNYLMNGLFPTICQKNVVNFYWAIWLNDYLKTFFHRVEEVSTKKKFKSNLVNLFLVIFPIFNFILFHVTRLLLCPFKRHNGLKSYIHWHHDKSNLGEVFYYSNRRQVFLKRPQ